MVRVCRVDSPGRDSQVHNPRKERSPRIQKTSGSKEKQGELLWVLAALDADALQGVLLERAKQAARARAGAAPALS